MFANRHHLVDLATNADIRVISFGVFQNQGWATFPQLDIARLPCSDSNASEPTSKKHPGHRFIKVLHLQVGILPVQAGELSPVRQELSFSLHGEQGPHLGHVLKLNIHKSNRLQLHLDQMLYVDVSFTRENTFKHKIKVFIFSSSPGTPLLLGGRQRQPLPSMFWFPLPSTVSDLTWKIIYF